MDIPDELKPSSNLPYWESPLPAKRERNPPAKLASSATPASRKQETKRVALQSPIPKPNFQPNPFGASSPMATQRNRAARGGPRGNGQDTGEEIALWTTSQEEIKKVCRSLVRAEQVREEIVAKETAFKAMEPASAYHFWFYQRKH